MYYPYLRGKQFDLLALKEAVSRELLSSQVIPVIEPVRDSPTLKTTLELFQKKKHPLFVIENPQVGQYKLFAERLHPWHVTKDSSLKSAWVLTPQRLPIILKTPPKLVVLDGSLTIHDPQVLEELSALPTTFLLAEDSPLRLWSPEKTIVLREAFQTRRHVETYLEKDDDFFTDSHLFYQEEKKGFADFTIEGSRYFDKGFPSRALAVHLTYVDAYGNIRVKHFVSDSNENASDQANKFFEAMEKMICWIYRHQHQLLITEGILELVKVYDQRKFPGLGVIKKWTLLHHLELMGSVLDYPDDWRRRSRVRELPYRK